MKNTGISLLFVFLCSIATFGSDQNCISKQKHPACVLALTNVLSVMKETEDMAEETIAKK